MAKKSKGSKEEKIMDDLKEAFDPTKGQWPTHYRLNSKALPLAFSEVTKLPSFEENGTTGLTYNEVMEIFGKFIFGYELSVGQAINSSDELGAYGLALARGRAARMIQAIAEKEKISVSKLMERLKIEGLNHMLMNYGVNKPQELKNLMAQDALFRTVPFDDTKTLEAVVKKMELGALGETSASDLPGKMLEYSVDKYHKL